jgi:hypothetical protein
MPLHRSRFATEKARFFCFGVSLLNRKNHSIWTLSVSTISYFPVQLNQLRTVVSALN